MNKPTIENESNLVSKIASIHNQLTYIFLFTSLILVVLNLVILLIDYYQTMNIPRAIIFGISAAPYFIFMILLPVFGIKYFISPIIISVLRKKILSD